MTLQRWLTNILPDYSLTAMLEDTDSLYESRELREADLIVSDTSLCDGDSIPHLCGMCLKTPMLFFSAYERKYHDFGGLNVVGFLLKPISETEISDVIQSCGFL